MIPRHWNFEDFEDFADFAESPLPYAEQVKRPPDSESRSLETVVGLEVSVFARIRLMYSLVV